MNRKYNYIYFDDGAVKRFSKDKDNYFYICTEELQQFEDIRVISYPMDYSFYIWHLLFAFHHHPKINRLIPLPFENIWYPFYFKNDFKEKRPLCFIMSAYYVKPGYLRYLKKKYQNCKIVLIHRDLIYLWEERNPAFTAQDMEELFDLRMTYDEEEAKKYGLHHFTEFESKTAVPMDPGYPLCDVFFAGYAKNRLSELLCAYDILTAAGLKCEYYIVGAAEDKQIARPGIVYASRQMSYREMLYRTVNAQCVLEINQAGAVGYTSRFLEAVMYDKKLITNNVSIKESPFYDPKYIQCIADIEKIDASFVKEDVGDVHYNYKGEFSPIHLINQIDQLLP